MSMTIKTVLTALVVLALVARFEGRFEPDSANFQLGTSVSTRVDVGNLTWKGSALDPPRLSEYDAIVLFVAGEQACPQAYSEFHDYKALVDSVAVGFHLAGAVLVLEDDRGMVEKRVRLSGLDLPQVGSGSGKLEDELAEWNGKPMGAQIAVLRTTDSTIVYQIPLFNTYTPRSAKIVALAAGLKAISGPQAIPRGHATRTSPGTTNTNNKKEVDR